MATSASTRAVSPRLLRCVPTASAVPNRVAVPLIESPPARAVADSNSRLFWGATDHASDWDVLLAATIGLQDGLGHRGVASCFRGGMGWVERDPSRKRLARSHDLN